MISSDYTLQAAERYYVQQQSVLPQTRRGKPNILKAYCVVVIRADINGGNQLAMTFLITLLSAPTDRNLPECKKYPRYWQLLGEDDLGNVHRRWTTSVQNIVTKMRWSGAVVVVKDASSGGKECNIYTWFDKKRMGIK